MHVERTKPFFFVSELTIHVQHHKNKKEQVVVFSGFHVPLNFDPQKFY